MKCSGIPIASLKSFSKRPAVKPSEHLSSIQDYALWYAKDAEKLKYRQPLQKKELGIGHGSGARYDQTDEEGKAFQLTSLTSNRPPGDFPVELNGKSYGPSGGYWKTGEDGFRLLIRAERVRLAGRTLRYVRYISDFPAYEVTNLWTDTAGSAGKVYVVQTSTAVVQRCLLMATDPGDLVLDPTADPAPLLPWPNSGAVAGSHHRHFACCARLGSRPHHGRALSL